MTLLKQAVFLDRDGVLNQAVVREGKPLPPARLDELVLVPGVQAAMARLREAGFLLIGVTNQPDVARGTTDRGSVEEIHQCLGNLLQLESILVCYHDDQDGCTCRKPLPGLLQEAAIRYGIDLRASFMVGDRWRDVEAGAAAGCRTIFIDYGYDERRACVIPSKTVHSITEAADWIVSGRISAASAENWELKGVRTSLER